MSVELILSAGNLTSDNDRKLSISMLEASGTELDSASQKSMMLALSAVLNVDPGSVIIKYTWVSGSTVTTTFAITLELFDFPDLIPSDLKPNSLIDAGESLFAQIQNRFAEAVTSRSLNSNIQRFAQDLNSTILQSEILISQSSFTKPAILFVTFETDSPTSAPTIATASIDTDGNSETFIFGVLSPGQFIALLILVLVLFVGFGIAYFYWGRNWCGVATSEFADTSVPHKLKERNWSLLQSLSLRPKRNHRKIYIGDFITDDVSTPTTIHSTNRSFEANSCIEAGSYSDNHHFSAVDTPHFCVSEPTFIPGTTITRPPLLNLHFQTDIPLRRMTDSPTSFDSGRSYSTDSGREDEVEDGNAAHNISVVIDDSYGSIAESKSAHDQAGSDQVVLAVSNIAGIDLRSRAGVPYISHRSPGGNRSPGHRSSSMCESVATEYLPAGDGIVSSMFNSLFDKFSNKRSQQIPSSPTNFSAYNRNSDQHGHRRNIRGSRNRRRRHRHTYSDSDALSIALSQVHSISEGECEVDEDDAQEPIVSDQQSRMNNSHHSESESILI